MEKLLIYLIVFAYGFCSIGGKDITLPALEPWVGWMMVIGVFFMIFFDARHWFNRRDDENDSGNTGSE